MKLIIVKRVGNILLIMGVLLLLISLLVDGVFSGVISITGIIIALAGLFLFLLFWKCPSCNKRLPFHGLLGMENCPYCGNEINI
ncbi:MAG: hypothetical protein RSB37_10380 [Acetivibrio sp.]